MLRKCISGGQTGADLAGVITAKKFGLETGGEMPKGFINLSGSHPEFAKLYGATENPSPKYPPRTEANVVNSDGTIRFAGNWNSPGELCTLKYIKKHNKVWIDVDVRNPRPVQEVVEWLKKYEIGVINIAGNSERSYSGTTEATMDYLTKVFTALGFTCKEEKHAD